MLLMSIRSGPRWIFLALFALGIWIADGRARAEPLSFVRAGLSERQAAAHLLDRFTFGARPGDVELLLEVGPRAWLDGQLIGDLTGAPLAAKLARFPALEQTGEEIVDTYSHASSFVDEAIRAGLFSRSAYLGDEGVQARNDALAALDRYALDRGYHPDLDLLGQLRAQKILRGLLTESQLNEVLTDFWFNHFNVTGSHPIARWHVLDYERQAIRPRVLSLFLNLLEATARHPAMLTYLDNASSRAEPQRKTAFDHLMEASHFAPAENPAWRQLMARLVDWQDPNFRRLDLSHRSGLNENYARELLELHTLGSGFSQNDVIEVARAFSGWGAVSIPRDLRFERLLDRVSEEGEFGFVRDGLFLFRPDRHDSERKQFLGYTLEAERGIEDGHDALRILAAHPTTARHLAGKLALRFVSDAPSAALIDHLAEVWTLSRGDQRSVLLALVESREFWQSRGEKIKSPFEFVISALRGLDADLSETEALQPWLGRMGQPLYGVQAPIGYPETGQAWLQTGPLLTRMNFAAQLARGQIEGISIDPLALVDEKMLFSRATAVEAFWQLLLPEREIPHDLLTRWESAEPEQELAAASEPSPQLAELRRRRWLNNATFAVAFVLASPEFQRR